MSILKNSKWLVAGAALAVSVAVVPGANAAAPVAVKLALTTPASTAVSGTAFATKPVVTIQDATGATVTTNTSAVTVAITGGTGGTLLGNTSKNAVAGVATFDALGIRGTAGTVYTLTYSDGSLAAATQTVTVTSRPFRLALTTPASGATSGVVFATQPVVTVQDIQGNASVLDADPVSVAITGGGDATLIGTPTSKTTAGVATFSGLGINGIPGVNYTLTFSQGGLVVARQLITLAEAPEPTPTSAPAPTKAPAVASTHAKSGNVSAGGSASGSKPEGKKAGDKKKK